VIYVIGRKKNKIGAPNAILIHLLNLLDSLSNPAQ
jgi:hypothetical protein